MYLKLRLSGTEFNLPGCKTRTTRIKMIAFPIWASQPALSSTVAPAVYGYPDADARRSCRKLVNAVIVYLRWVTYCNN